MDFVDPLITVGSELPIKVMPKDSYGNEVDISQKLILLNVKEVIVPEIPLYDNVCGILQVSW